MKNIFRSPVSAAVISIILCLPFAILFTLVMLDIEPNFGPLSPYLTAPASRIGSYIPLGAILLLPVAFFINLAVIMRDTRDGKSVISHPINLVLAIAILAMMTIIVGGIIIDQYPCWIGVPNCD